MSTGIFKFCTVTFVLQFLPVYCDDNTKDRPDYYHSPYFTEHLHFSFDLCSKQYVEKFDPSFILFLQNKLVLNMNSDEPCIIGCTLRNLGMFKNGNNLDLIALGQWLRSNLRKDLPQREQFIGYYVSLASWCLPDATISETCSIGKYYYRCVRDIMASMTMPTVDWSQWKRNPFEIV